MPYYINLHMYFDDIEAVFVLAVWLSVGRRAMSHVSHIGDPFCRGVAVKVVRLRIRMQAERRKATKTTGTVLYLSYCSTNGCRKLGVNASEMKEFETRNGRRLSFPRGQRHLSLSSV